MKKLILSILFCFVAFYSFGYQIKDNFTGLICFINFIVSLYLINFYFEENTVIERKE